MRGNATGGAANVRGRRERGGNCHKGEGGARIGAGPLSGGPRHALRCGMNERDDRKSQRRPRPDRAERLAAALRANLKRRKAQARGRAEAADHDENRPNQPNPDTKDR